MNPSALLALVALTACATTPELPPGLGDEAQTPDQEWHRGPSVEVSTAGPARFVGPLFGSFRRQRAMDVVRFTEGFYRAAANPAYDAVLDRVEHELRSAGFGEDPRLTLEFLTRRTVRSWTAVKGSLVLHAPGASPKTLHHFEHPGDVDRVILPVDAPSGHVRGPVVLHLEDVEPGTILATDVPLRQVLDRAAVRGAVGVVSASLGVYNVDPSGKERHLDAIQYRKLSSEPAIPVMQISPRSFEAVRMACLQSEGTTRRVELELTAEVTWEERPLRTLVATVRGARAPGEAVTMGSHVNEPGACDNATGVAGLLESARSLAELLTSGELPWPARSLVFLWGDEFRQTTDWLTAERARTVAGLSSDMTGQARETGAIALLERMPDPGALVPLAPDEHTPWGAGQVDEDELMPNGLAVIARCAMVDVGLHDGGWPSADHPWEGGSDHDEFIRLGIPAVLFWHFTDFTYHTSLDRLEFVDPDEIRRTAVALLSTALAVADPKPTDLDRYLKSLSLEERVRVDAAREAGLDQLADQWEDWSRGARGWFRNLCLWIDEPLPEVPADPPPAPQAGAE